MEEQLRSWVPEKLAEMALLDTPQAVYGSMTSPYLIQNPYSRGYYRDYEQDTITRLNIHQRLQASPEYPAAGRSVKEEFSTAFKPYSSPGQENLPVHHNQQTKVFTTLSLGSNPSLRGCVASPGRLMVGTLQGL